MYSVPLRIRLLIACAYLQMNFYSSLAHANPDNFSLLGLDGGTGLTSVGIFLDGPEGASFQGEPIIELVPSNTDDDYIEIRVNGYLKPPNRGCAKLKLEYLPEQTGVTNTDSTDSVTSYKYIREFTHKRGYTKVRVILLTGSTCSNLSNRDEQLIEFNTHEVYNNNVNPKDHKFKNTSAEMLGNLGSDNIWVKGPWQPFAEWAYDGGSAAVIHRWLIETNIPPVRDRGDAYIKAFLKFSKIGYHGCVWLESAFLDSNNDVLDYIQTEKICDEDSPDGKVVDMPNFDSHPDLDAVRLRLVTSSWDILGIFGEEEHKDPTSRSVHWY